jgi:predicted flavoprotein YhiN
MAEFFVKTSRHCEIIDITEDVNRVLPQSMKAQDVLNAFLKAAKENRFAVRYGQKVTGIEVLPQEAAGEKGTLYRIRTEGEAESHYLARTLIIATGGCSYPVTGSDGAVFEILQRDLGVASTPLSPALVPIVPEAYPYEELAGITLPRVRASIHRDGAKSERFARKLVC